MAFPRIPLTGPALEEERVDFWPDGWAGRAFAVTIRVVQPIRSVRVRGVVPGALPETGLSVSVNGDERLRRTVKSGPFTLEFPVQFEAGDLLRLGVFAGASFCPARTGTSGDRRELVFLLSEIRCSDRIPSAWRSWVARLFGGTAHPAASGPAEPDSARLPELAVFHEEWPAEPSRFDHERDEAVGRRARETGTLGGFCNIAGRETRFAVTSENFREDIVAAVSASTNRHRHLLCGLGLALTGRPGTGLPELADHINARGLRVFMAETSSVLSEAFGRRLRPDLLVCSEYFGPEYRSGETVRGVLHQDLERTSFDDGAFDLVITSDVFEHIPDAVAAEQEVMRILRPGGVYCFTVPSAPAAGHDLVLAERGPDGAVRYLAEPQYHSDPLRPEGILVYRIFSFRDMKRRFEARGHTFATFRFWSEELGILGDNAWVHTVRKRS